MQITLPDDADIETVVAMTRRAWAQHKMIPGEGIPQAAKRIGVTYRQLRRWLRGEYGRRLLAVPSDEIVMVESEPTAACCEFCGGKSNIHEHHVVNRHDSPVTVRLCAVCHRKFHFLARLFVDRRKKT